jgi:uncharacterized membrane protein
MLFYLKLYVLTVPVFLVVDLLWLGVIARDFYRTSLAHVLSPTVNWTAAIAFYLIYIAGILYFAVLPGLAEESLRRTLIQAALFGFFTYMTYELTNMATIADWPMKVVVVDILWGILLCTSVAAGSFYLGRWLT